MKSITNKIVVLATALTAMVSCTTEEKDIFDKSAAERLNESVDSYQKLLMDSENGWAMEFFPSAGQYGGYVLTAKFNNGDVDMTSIMDFDATSSAPAAPAGTVVSSKYSVKAEQSVILTFDTYNRLLHFFSQPNGSNDPDGYESDYEFVFMRTSADGDSIFLRGKKYENEMVMVRLKESGSQYVKAINEIDVNISSAPYTTMTLGGKDYQVSFAGNILSLTDAEGNNFAMPFVFNRQGIRLYQPLEVDGHTICSLAYNPADGALKTNDGAGEVTLPEGIEQFIHANQPWIFQANREKGEMCDDLYEKLVKVANLRSTVDFDYGCIMTPDRPADITKGFEKVISFRWSMKSAFGYSYAWLNNGISMSRSETGSQNIDIKDAGVGYGYTTSYKRKVGAFFDTIFESSPYTVTFNDGGLKTEAKFVSVANPNVWFTLKLNHIIE